MLTYCLHECTTAPHTLMCFINRTLVKCAGAAESLSRSSSRECKARTSRPGVRDAPAASSLPRSPGPRRLGCLHSAQMQLASEGGLRPDVCGHDEACAVSARRAAAACGGDWGTAVRRWMLGPRKQVLAQAQLLHGFERWSLDMGPAPHPRRERRQLYLQDSLLVDALFI